MLSETQREKPFSFLQGGGEMGHRIRNFDWSKTPLGTPDTWDSSLKTCVRIMLTSPQPMFVWWGDELINIYNDAYRFVLGNKHPQMLGISGKIVWKEIWSELWKRAEIVFTKNEGTFDDALLLVMNRYGYDEETYFKFSYNPVPGDEGGTKGLFCACTEETQRIINERSLATLREVGAMTFEEKSLDVIYHNVADALGKNNKDFPFAVIYKIDNEKKSAYATAYAGIGEDQKVFPSVIDIKNPAEGTYNFYTAYKKNQLVLSENNGRRKNLPTGFWDKEAAQFIHIPVTGPGKSYPYAVISAALNPYRKFDDTYRQFCELIGERVSLEVNKMLALEEERKRAEALAEIDKAKTVFFSNISHEFRTPLTLMLSPLEELLKQRQSNLTKEEKQNIETAHRNSLRLLKLVNALLDFSRLESGRQQAAFSLTDIAALTKNLAANFRSVIEKAGLQLEVHTDENMLPVYADKQMWEKIVFNLLSNAFKYTLKGKITVEVLSEENFAVLKVKDTGVGIPEKELPLMFERFHRVPQGAARTYEGTGIGLSLTKELVQMHGGSIAVESKLNEGSTFIIKIPFGKEHLLPKHIMADEKDSDDTAADIYIEEVETLFEINEDDKAPVTAENKKLPYILVADDNADMREHIESLLSKQFNIITAKNGSDALGKIKERKPDLIVSDIMMPVMDGIELLKKIKSNKLTAHIPVILLTARAGEESKIEGWETGADDYLVKPFSGKELAARIKAHITLKQKTQEELKKIYQFFDDVPFAIAVLKDKNLVIDFINKYNLEIWGAKKENVLGKPLFEARPDIKENVEEIHNTVYKTGERFFAEEIPVEINNKTRYFDAIIDPMRDEAGNMIGQIATSIEVTEKAEARKKIEESEKKFRALSEATSAIVWTTTADGKFSTLQPSWEKYTGQSWDEYKEWGWANAIHPDDREFVERLWKEALAEKRNYHSWGRLWSARHQAWRYYDGKAIPLKDDNGEILEWIGIVYDVHEQEMARRKIEANEKELQSLVMQAPVAIVLVEGENLVAKVANTRALEIMGKTEAEVLNKQMAEYFPELPERKNIYRQVFKTGIPYSGTEVEVSFNKNGKPYTGYFDLNYTPWFGADGKIKGVMSVGAEVTEKVLARRKVEENFIENSRLAAIVQSSEDAIISKTLEGIVTSWNPGAEKLFGYSAEEMIGQSITKIIPVDRLQEEPDILNRIQQGENIDHFQTQRIDKKGNLIDISLAISPIKNNEGKIVGASKIARNITAEKRAEEKVKASEKKLLNIFSQTPAAIAVLEGPEHRFVLANTAAQKMVNRSQEELLGKTVKEIFPELEGQGIVEVFDHVFATGQITLLQEVAILVDLLNEGIVRQHYFNLSTEPVRDSEGEIQSVAVVAFDVTEMAEARKKIEESEKHLELVSNTVPALIFYLDKEHHYVTVNNAFTEWFGISAEEVTGQTVKEFMGEKAWEVIEPHLQLAHAGETVHYQAKINHREGGKRWVNVAYTPHKNKNEVEGVIVLITDITQQKKAEEKIKESEQELQNIKEQLELSINAGQIGLWHLDTKTNVLKWSREQLEMYGLNESSAIQTPDDFYSFILPEDLKSIQDEAILNTKKTDQQYNFRIRRKDGEIRWIHARSKNVYDETGELVYITGINIDITEQKQAEEAIIQNEKQLNELANAMPQLVWMADAAGNVIYYNNRITEFSGVEKNDKGEWIWNGLVHPEDIASTAQEWQNALNNKTHYTKEHRIQSKDGTYRWFLSRAYPQKDEEGNIIKWFGTATDIHELKMHEQRKDDFIKIASHELKTPVTSIKGYIQLLLLKYQHSGDVLLQQSLATADRQVIKLTKLIADLLDVTRIESGKLLLDKTSFSLNALIEEAAADVKNVWSHHHIIFRSSEPIEIMADRNRILQVITNLLTNAAKYSPDADRVIVQLKKIADSITVSVQDFGIGIHPSEHGKIFERFYRSEGRDEKTFPGFGIGLFIVAEIIKQHDGKIWVESEKGKGSIFYFSLPQ